MFAFRRSFEYQIVYETNLIFLFISGYSHIACLIYFPISLVIYRYCTEVDCDTVSRRRWIIRSLLLVFQLGALVRFVYFHLRQSSVQKTCHDYCRASEGHETLQLCFHYVCVCNRGVPVKIFLKRYNKVYLMIFAHFIFLINITKNSYYRACESMLD